MVIDTIENARLYYGMGKGLETALKYLSQTDFSGMKPGRYEVDGGGVYTLVHAYTTQSPDGAKWEAHHKYYDVQYVAQGEEMLGYANIKDMKAAGDYDSGEDCVILEGEGNMLLLKSGMFMILSPADAHCPGVMAGTPAEVKKVVVKVRLPGEKIEINGSL